MFVSFFGLFTVVSDVQFAFVLFSVNQINAAGNVDDGLGGVQLNCLVNSGLEALEVNDSPCLGELLNLLVRQFEVVRLRSRRSERFDVNQIAADLLGEVLERVEAGHDLHGRSGSLGARGA